MRCINDQSAAFFNDRPEPITRFASNPEIVIMRIEQCNHSFVLSAGVLAVHMAAYCGRLPHCTAKVATEQGMHSQPAVVAIHNRIGARKGGWKAHECGIAF